MSGPVGIQLSGVVARDRRGPRGRAWGALAGVTATFERGVHAVAGAPADGSVALVDILAGVLRPRRGRVELDGRQPARDPRLRRRIGCLGYEPELPARGTVAELGRRLERAPDGIPDLVERPLASLSHREARRVELALALATATPAALVLFEPWTAWRPADPVELAPRLRAHADAGATVIVVAAELPGAEAWADHVHLLARGHLVGRDHEVGWPLVAPAWLTVVLATVAEARTLARELLHSEGVRSLAWDGATVTLQAEDPDGAAAAVADVAVAHGLDVCALQPASPRRETLLLTAQRLYERRQASSAMPRPAAPAVASSPVSGSASREASEPAKTPGPASSSALAPAAPSQEDSS